MPRIMGPWQDSPRQHVREGAIPQRALLPIARCPYCQQDVYCDAERVSESAEVNFKGVAYSWQVETMRAIELTHYTPHAPGPGWERHAWTLEGALHVSPRMALHITPTHMESRSC